MGGSDVDGEVGGVEVREDAVEVDFEDVEVVCWTDGDLEVVERESRSSGSESSWRWTEDEFGRGSFVSEDLRGGDVEEEGVGLGEVEEGVDSGVR